MILLVIMGALAIPVSYFVYTALVVMRGTTELTRRRNAWASAEAKRLRPTPVGLAALWARRLP